MKIKLTKAQIDEILANPEKAHEAGIKTVYPSIFAVVLEGTWKKVGRRLNS